jgi:NADH-quinone oxidoreductase subunit N
MSELILLKHELLLTLLLFIFILVKLGRGLSDFSFLKLANSLLLLNFIIGFSGNQDGEMFASLFHTNPLMVLQKNILNGGLLIISLFSTRWLLKHAHLPEFFMLMVSSLLGMFFMISANNLLVLYLALELATLPLAALCNFDLDKRQSSEAGMKMIMSSAFASGMLLMGISLVYGLTGTLSLAEIPLRLEADRLTMVAFVFLFAGFAFKLSVVPFHLWTADVYQGSPVAVTAFLSVISKGAMVFVFTTLLYQAFKPLQEVLYLLIVAGAVLSMTLGNLFALHQQNIKRFLAFSSIAQVGFILTGISGYSLTAASSASYFVLVYVFSNLAAFSVVAVVSSFSGKETIDDFKGFYHTNPLLSWVMALALFSLAGIPPTAGFFGKFFLLTSGAANGNFILITIAALNMIVALYYYLRLIRAMFMESSGNAISPVALTLNEKLAITICVAGILVSGIWNVPFNSIHRHASEAFSMSFF